MFNICCNFSYIEEIEGKRLQKVNYLSCIQRFGQDRDKNWKTFASIRWTPSETKNCTQTNR